MYYNASSKCGRQHDHLDGESEVTLEISEVVGVRKEQGVRQSWPRMGEKNKVRRSNCMLERYTRT